VNDLQRQARKHAQAVQAREEQLAEAVADVRRLRSYVRQLETALGEAEAPLMWASGDTKKIDNSGAPRTMYGMRRPKRERVRSLK